MEQVEMFEETYHHNKLYKDALIKLLNGGAVSLSRLFASGICVDKLKRSARRYTKREVKFKKYKNQFFLIIPKNGVSASEALKRGYERFCDKFIKDNLYKHEGGYREI